MVRINTRCQLWGCVTDFFNSKMTDVYEGSLIRVFRRLEELIRQMAMAAKVMGNNDLEQKFEISMAKVKRGMSK